jgi:hypothetical protein
MQLKQIMIDLVFNPDKVIKEINYLDISQITTEKDFESVVHGMEATGLKPAGFDMRLELDKEFIFHFIGINGNWKVDIRFDKDLIQRGVWIS